MAIAAEKGDVDPEFAMMERNGITRVTVHHYHVDGYRYGTIADALSQVRRGASSRYRP